jgi:hypothetical protein
MVEKNPSPSIGRQLYTPLKEPRDKQAATASFTVAACYAALCYTQVDLSIGLHQPLLTCYNSQENLAYEESRLISKPHLPSLPFVNYIHEQHGKQPITAVKSVTFRRSLVYFVNLPFSLYTQ